MFHRIQVFRGTSTRQGDKGCSTRSLEHRLRLYRCCPAAPRRDSVWKDTRPRQRGVAHSPNRTTDTPPLRKGGSPRPAGGGTPSCGAKPGTPWTCLQCGGRGSREAAHRLARRAPRGQCARCRKGPPQGALRGQEKLLRLLQQEMQAGSPETTAAPRGPTTRKAASG